MKYLLLFACCMLSTTLFSQNIQLHYDFRHTIDPAHNSQNFPTLYFEYFKSLDSGKSFIKPGAFFIKMESDLQGDGGNIGKAFIQASQTFRFWQPKIYLSAQYSGGLGVTNPAQYSYYINNALSLGPSYSFQWQGAYFTSTVYYTYNMLKKPSNDIMLSFYWGKGFWNYKVEFAGDFELYTLNKNLGDDLTKDMHGKTVSFFGEPQVWFKIKGNFSMGSKILLYYHVITTENLFEVYPTIAARVKF
ncbi:DUF5020 family protein [Mucilaginibacter sp. X4EP1]|uniref:DUF5020 family protein n=1 Tax=Mucilaginibacter sp. X4EP1 TaxID=2723092 RepID=UPI00216A0CC9|nr:DUF5020 family protein [Mucilaginibacter sp. X4EP1]MCS3812620.1 hypothetical protein [Mucilaginibacter sp. X4EP1]